jgi:hypothetical protein
MDTDFLPGPNFLLFPLKKRRFRTHLACFGGLRHCCCCCCWRLFCCTERSLRQVTFTARHVCSLAAGPCTLLSPLLNISFRSSVDKRPPMNANYNGIDGTGPKVAPMFLFFLIERNGKEPKAFSIFNGRRNGNKQQERFVKKKFFIKKCAGRSASTGRSAHLRHISPLRCHCVSAKCSHQSAIDVHNQRLFGHTAGRRVCSDRCIDGPEYR